MAHSQETRDTVRRLYIEGMPLNGAAITAGVSYDTAQDWKRRAKGKGDDWDTARSAYRISEQGIGDLNQQLVEDFARQVLTTTRELESSTIPASEPVVGAAGRCLCQVFEGIRADQPGLLGLVGGAGHPQDDCRPPSP